MVPVLRSFSHYGLRTSSPFLELRPLTISTNSGCDPFSSWLLLKLPSRMSWSGGFCGGSTCLPDTGPKLPYHFMQASQQLTDGKDCRNRLVTHPLIYSVIILGTVNGTKAFWVYCSSVKPSKLRADREVLPCTSTPLEGKRGHDQFARNEKPRLVKHGTGKTRRKFVTKGISR